jgi:hypothetical protein
MNDYELNMKTKKVLNKINRIEKINFIEKMEVEFEADGIIYIHASDGNKMLASYDIPLEIVVDEEKQIEYLNKLRKNKGVPMNPVNETLKNKFEQYQELGEELEMKAMEVLSEINKIKPISGYIHLCVSSIESDCIEFFGEEHWRYGGYDSHSFEFKTELIYDQEAKNEYLENLLSEKEKKEKKQKEIQDRLDKEKEEKEHKKYLELKNKYEEEK